MRTFGITTTLPIEVPYAAGWRVIDLNNAFVGSPDASELVAAAERVGFPKTYCAWIKGIYGVVARARPDAVAIVSGGDCTHTRLLGEILESEGVQVVHFRFPYPADRVELREEIEAFCRVMGTTPEAAQKMKRRLDRTRRLLVRLDELVWNEHRVSGSETQRWLLGACDFEGDPDGFRRRLAEFLEEAERRPPDPPTIRLGYVGVPPVVSGLHAFLRDRGADVLYHETHRQFAGVPPADDLVEHYHRFTYPYAFAGRAADVIAETRRRRLDGLIHYTQAFCFRQACDMLLRGALETSGVNVPVLLLQGDAPGPLSAQECTRLEAFCEMLCPP